MYGYINKSYIFLVLLKKSPLLLHLEPGGDIQIPAYSSPPVNHPDSQKQGAWVVFCFFKLKPKACYKVKNDQSLAAMKIQINYPWGTCSAHQL